MPTILEIVKANAKEFVDKEGALKALEFSKQQIGVLTLDKEIKDLYELKIFFIDDNNAIVGVSVIGRWLKDNANDFFATPKYLDYVDPYDGEPHTRLVGYNLLIDDAPFKGANIEVSSKFPNLKSYRCNVAILISKKQLTFFYCISQYLENGWDEKKIDTEKMKWTYTNTKIANNDSISGGIKLILQYINDKVKSDVSIQFGLKTEDEKVDDLPF